MNQACLADWKSVAPITVFITLNPAPVRGSNSALRTASCCPGSGSVLSVTRPASRNDAPKPAIVWYRVRSSTVTVTAASGTGSANDTGGCALIRSPSCDVT